MYIQAQFDRLRQGDVLRDIVLKDAYNTGNEITVPFIVILTQDCDLEQEREAIKAIAETLEPGYVLEKGKSPPTNDKYLNNILVCPAFIAVDVHNGDHFAQLEWTMTHHSSQIELNNNPRYHFLAANKSFSVPALCMDFKRVFTLPRDYMERSLQNKAAKLEDLFAQAVSNRFTAFTSRVALPVLDEDGEIKKEL